MGFVKDFKDFAMKGNVLDLAIGVILGAAFGKIVTSLVEDIIMPPLGVVINGIDFTKLKLKISDGALNPATGKITGDPVFISYGNFLQILLQFIIVALVIFMITRAIMNINRKKDAQVQQTPAPPELSTSEKLLMEIRDSLKNGGQRM